MISLPVFTTVLFLIPLSRFSVCVSHALCLPVSLSYLSVLFFLSCSLSARVCDNEMLRCQNGGACLNNLRCQCPSGFTGLLCEKAQCENEAGGCSGGPDSGAPSALAHHPALAALLLPLALTLAPVLLGEACWASSV